MHALDKRDHPLEPNEGAGELQLISPDRDLRIGGGQGLKAAAEQGCLVFCAEGGRAFNLCSRSGIRVVAAAGGLRLADVALDDESLVGHGLQRRPSRPRCKSWWPAGL